MRVFDSHIHMTSRTTDDYRAMADAGVRALVEPAFWLGQPRTSPDTFLDYFDSLLGWEPYRAAQFGIAHFCALAVNPKEANDSRCASVLDALPRYLEKDRVVAVGEVGLDSGTSAEEQVMARQLRLAREHGLPVVIHTPHRDKTGGTKRILDLVSESGIDPGMVVVDHLNELTVAEVRASGCWTGFTIYPDTKMDPVRMAIVAEEYGTERMLVNSAADWGISDPLATVRTWEALRAAGFGEEAVQGLFWDNPVAFYGQSGRLQLDEESTAELGADAFDGNTILRGEK
ncbi:TatD family hydrolase [Streptomyces acidiscabies]|uniref:TatD family hydrolase n=1 Tax=Streptomyces acidiscabies TaxID=42234 RepID=UPI0038F5EF12